MKPISICLLSVVVVAVSHLQAADRAIPSPRPLARAPDESPFKGIYPTPIQKPLGTNRTDVVSLPRPPIAVDLESRSDPEIQAAYKKWVIATMEREVEILKEHRLAFADVGVMSRLVCWVAHVLLTLSVVAASIEFYRASTTRRKASTEPQEVKVSLEGIALKTSLHGTFLLGIAMVFYYLFLKFVYPISLV